MSVTHVEDEKFVIQTRNFTLEMEGNPSVQESLVKCSVHEIVNARRENRTNVSDIFFLYLCSQLSKLHIPSP